MIAEAGFRQYRLWFLKLGVPVHIVQPYPIQIVLLQQFPQQLFSVSPETRFGRTNTHEPGGGFSFFTLFIQRPCFRMTIYIILTIQGWKLGEHPQSFSSCLLHHLPADGSAMDEDRVNTQAVKSHAFLPESFGITINSTDVYFTGRRLFLTAQ